MDQRKRKNNSRQPDNFHKFEISWLCWKWECGDKDKAFNAFKEIKLLLSSDILDGQLFEQTFFILGQHSNYMRVYTLQILYVACHVRRVLFHLKLQHHILRKKYPKIE
jgi:hypothetical protein